MDAKDRAKTILVADDDVDFRTQLVVQLGAAGFRVVAAEGRAAAEELIAQTRPDLAVVDLMMEEMDGGFALCHHIKKLDPTIPIILVTAVAGETGHRFDAATDEERAWVKADVLLAKPIRFEQLRREIDRLLKETP